MDLKGGGKIKNRVLFISLAMVLALSIGIIGCEAEAIPAGHQYSLTISSSGCGWVNTPGEGIFHYDEGTVVELVANTVGDNPFVGWIGDVSTIADVEDATTITMNDDYSITARFKSDAPASFSATIAGTTQIDLSWTKGSGAEKTNIQRKEGSYPTDRNDGTQVYFDTGTSTPDTRLTPGTTYYYRAWSYVQGSEQWSDGSAEDYATTTAIGAPTVTTNAAALWGGTFATLNGVITNDGGEACQYRFEYDTDSGEPYAYNTGWKGSKTTGQSFSFNLFSLDTATKYYFRAQAKNSAGTGSGSELTFIIKPGPPWGFSATTVGTTQIDLSWTKRAGTRKTNIQRKEGSYPTDRNDGIQVYFDTGTSTSDTGLTPGTTYYYRAWSYDQGIEQWSDNYAQASATTTAIGALTVTTTELPDSQVGVAYEASLEASGGTEPYAWAIIDGALPDGLGLNANSGVISGTPTIGGILTFTVQVTDDEGLGATRTLLIMVYGTDGTTATRTLPVAVEPGAEFDVGIVASGCGSFGQVRETLPDGFTYVSVSEPEDFMVQMKNGEVWFTFLGDSISFSYTVQAPTSEYTYTFGGVVLDVDSVPYPVGGYTSVTVWDPWIYDENSDGIIQMGEALKAVQEYFAELITKVQVLEILQLYFS